MGRRGRAGYHGAHDRIREQPPDGELADRVAPRGGEGFVAFGDIEVLLGEPRLPESLVPGHPGAGRRFGVPPVPSGEEAAREGLVRNDRQTEVRALRHHLLLYGAVEKAV